MTHAPQQPPAGWYPDPAGTDGERYWDGIAWSQATRDKVVLAPPTEPPVAGYGQPSAGYGRPMSGDAARTGAPFGWRFLGFFIDFVLFNVVGGLVLSTTGVSQRLDGELDRWMKAFLLWADTGATGGVPMPSAEFWNVALLSTVISIAVFALYRTVMLGLFSATVGQLAVGLRTVRLGADPTSKLGWGVAALRGVIGAILYQHFLVGFVNGIFAAFTKNRQTLSDMLSKTQVLKIR